MGLHRLIFVSLYWPRRFRDYDSTFFANVSLQSRKRLDTWNGSGEAHRLATGGSI